MNGSQIVMALLAGFGAAGFCLMVAAFVLIARQGGWKQGIQQPIAEGRWPPARRLMLTGAALATIFAVGWFVFSLIPGGRRWVKPSVEAELAKRLIGKWEMADRSDYVIEFTGEGTMSVRNGAGEPQVLMAGDENLPYKTIILSQDGLKKVMFPGSVSNPLEFVRQK